MALTVSEKNSTF